MQRRKIRLRLCIGKRGGDRHTNEAVRKTRMMKKMMCNGKKKFNRFKGKNVWKSDVGIERAVTHHEVSRNQKRATAQNQDEIDRYILVRKMDRTTY